MTESSAGWSGTVSEFVAASITQVSRDLDGFVSALLLPVEDPQRRAWASSLALLQDNCRRLVSQYPDAQRWGLILEYELPRERGRRPDILVHSGRALGVIEFKGRPYAEQADLDQVQAYGRDLADYHGASHHLRIEPILSLDATYAAPEKDDDIWVVGGKRLSDCLAGLRDDPPAAAPDVESWLRADYEPLPTLVRAARQIFEHEPLPRIHRAESAGIPQALATLQAIARQARVSGERHIALVTGVPGAGKTLVGLQFVYQTRFTADDAERPAIFLSGNGPLVDVLQHALRSRIFVQDVHGFLKQYGGATSRRPQEHIWVYDEAQRAWDADRSQMKRGHDISEHQDFVNLGTRMPGWSTLVGLVGQGQEIHLGEEGGLELWNEAISKSSERWYVHCPRHVAGIFAGREVIVNDALDLTMTLRSHRAGDVHAWVRELLNGNLVAASDLATRIHDAAFHIYVTRNLDDAKAYVRARYAGDIDSRYGLIASSKARNLAQYGMDASFQTTRRLRPGPWFNDDLNSPDSCCQLRQVATEFACQGLELDFPIVGWDTDLLWDGSHWVSPPSPRSGARDPHQLRVNSYRVLLTRGRDGMAIFIPPIEPLKATYDALTAAGARSLRLLA